jgi:23S rRNA-intervening sequence protein
MKSKSFENLRVYRLSEELADCLWEVIGGWKGLARDTVGKQAVRAADGIGANIAEWPRYVRRQSSLCANGSGFAVRSSTLAPAIIPKRAPEDKRGQQVENRPRQPWPATEQLSEINRSDKT